PMLALKAPPAASSRASQLSTELPIQSRIWHLYCQGYSKTAISEQVGLERHSVARHIHAVEALLAKEHADDLDLARQRALEATYNLFAVTMARLSSENERED